MQLQGARILLLGLTYKPGIADTRESAGIKLLNLLLESGASVEFHDPLINVATTARGEKQRLELSPNMTDSFDFCVVIQPAHEYPSFTAAVPPEKVLNFSLDDRLGQSFWRGGG